MITIVIMALIMYLYAILLQLNRKGKINLWNRKYTEEDKERLKKFEPIIQVVAIIAGNIFLLIGLFVLR